MARLFHRNLSMSAENQKRLAAEKAVESIQDGMVIGLGTGSTVQYALEAISKKIKNGSLKNIVGVPTSVKTKNEANKLDIPLITLNELYKNYDLRFTNYDLNESQFSIPNSQFAIDLTIDGADEATVSRSVRSEKSITINLIKGGGGALLHEKVIAQNSKKVIIIIDEKKLSKKLGEKSSVPVEVFQFSFEAEKFFLESIGANVSVRKNSTGENFITDENNFIVDANFGVIDNADELNKILNNRAGIIEHGLFIDIADEIICGEKIIVMSEEI